MIKYNVVERTDGLGTTTWIRWNEVRSALKLQELIIERIAEIETQIVTIQDYPDGEINKSLRIHDAKYEQDILQRRLDESQNTKKETSSNLGKGEEK